MSPLPLDSCIRPAALAGGEEPGTFCSQATTPAPLVVCRSHACVFLGRISLLNLAQKLNQRAMFYLKDLSALCALKGNEVRWGRKEGHLWRVPWDLRSGSKAAPCSPCPLQERLLDKHLEVVAGIFYRGSPLSESRERRPERKEILSEAEPEILPGVERIPGQQKHIHQKQRQTGDAAQNRRKELPVRAHFTGETSRGMRGKLYNTLQPIIGA